MTALATVQEEESSRGFSYNSLGQITTESSTQGQCCLIDFSIGKAVEKHGVEAMVV